MNVQTIREAIAARCRLVDDLNVYAYEPDTIVTPAAIVRPDETEFVKVYGTMAHSLMDVRFTVRVLVQAVDEEAAANELDGYLSTNVATSLLDVLDTPQALSGVWESITAPTIGGYTPIERIAANGQTTARYLGADIAVVVKARRN